MVTDPIRVELRRRSVYSDPPTRRNSTRCELRRYKWALTHTHIDKRNYYKQYHLTMLSLCRWSYQPADQILYSAQLTEYLH